MDKKQYTPREAAIALLEKIKEKAVSHMAKKEEKTEPEALEKAAPQNQTAAQVAGIKVPQPKPPKATEKVITTTKEPLKLKKFLDGRGEKKMKKAESKHDRCVKEVEEKSPEVKSPHAVCVAAGVKPAKWSK